MIELELVAAADAAERTRVDTIVSLIAEVGSLSRLSRVHVSWEERMKALAADRLKPGSDEPIDDVDALDYIWELTGDSSWSSAQTERFRLRALDYYVGRKVRHVWGTGVLVKIARKGADARYAIRVRMVCAQCERGTVTVYAQPGCHRGAFCYIYDRAGNYLADLRNQIVICARCAPRRKR